MLFFRIIRITGDGVKHVIQSLELYAYGYKMAYRVNDGCVFMISAMLYTQDKTSSDEEEEKFA